MERLSTGIRVFLLAMPLTALLLGVAYQREQSSSFLDGGENAYQGKSFFGARTILSGPLLQQSLTIGRIIAKQVDPSEWSQSEVTDLATYIVLKSRQYKLSPYLVLSLIHVESRFRPTAISPRGAIGLMQLMPSTAEELALGLGIQQRNAETYADPKVNIELALRYINQLKTQFPSNAHMLTAYNMGPAALIRKLKNGDDVSMEYYKKVMEMLETYRREAETVGTNKWL